MWTPDAHLHLDIREAQGLLAPIETSISSCVEASTVRMSFWKLLEPPPRRSLLPKFLHRCQQPPAGSR